MTFQVIKPIDEQDAVATLRLILQEVVRQNKACTVLIRSSFKDLSTPNAHVVLTFDDANCQSTQSATT